MNSMNKKILLCVSIAFVVISMTATEPTMTCFTEQLRQKQLKPVIIQMSEDEIITDAVSQLEVYLGDCRLRQPINLDDVAHIEKHAISEVFIVGHGNKQGLELKSAIISWKQLETCLDNSKSYRHYILACHSKPLLQNQKVLTAFSDQIDVDIAIEVTKNVREMHTNMKGNTIDQNHITSHHKLTLKNFLQTTNYNIRNWKDSRNKDQEKFINPKDSQNTKLTNFKIIIDSILRIRSMLQHKSETDTFKYLRLIGGGGGGDDDPPGPISESGHEFAIWGDHISTWIGHQENILWMNFDKGLGKALLNIDTSAVIATIVSQISETGLVAAAGEAIIDKIGVNVILGVELTAAVWAAIILILVLVILIEFSSMMTQSNANRAIDDYCVGVGAEIIGLTWIWRDNDSTPGYDDGVGEAGKSKVYCPLPLLTSLVGAALGGGLGALVGVLIGTEGLYFAFELIYQATHSSGWLGIL